MKNTDPLEVLRNNIYEVMRREQWSVQHIVVVCGVPYETMRRITLGNKGSIQLSTVGKIAEGLGVPVSTLFETKKGGVR